ncbi:phospho-N-acetylmuramoyl-pentapeptide-transferase [Brevibacillus sp. B_LB10_24]|uniref:phospho-N-acetylmuramoyl-pentapeptide- transferase n=1 Tax=Brevibacillus sp. B_LB10_24 TaxID=3380645 RepID=UPI0038BAFF9E
MLFDNVLIITIIAAFLIAVLVGPLFIPVLRRMKFGQSIRVEGPQSHQKKAGTPTMGGTIIMLALIFTVLKFANLSMEIFFLMLVTLGYGLIGFLDDFIKINKKRNLGLTAKQKFLAQILLAILAYALLVTMGHDTSLHVPGTSWDIHLGWLYFPFLVFLFVGTTNAVNITDGLDGLLAGTGAIAFGAYAIIAWMLGKADTAVFSAAIVGAVLGFLVFNAHPARVFMGDTGSLALGGALAGVAIMTKTELLLAVIGGVFVVETLSVILQVVSFKTRGKRIFRMSPLHHHFELTGWSEWRVVVTFWLVAMVFAGLGVYLEVVR